MQTVTATQTSTIPATQPRTRAEAAAQYIAEGYAVVPIPAGQKGPVKPNWQQRTFTPDDFPGDENIGILTGARSGGLVDVDLDCKEAVKAAEYLLPPTGMIHGRKSKRTSHYWYRVTTNLPAARKAYEEKKVSTSGKDEKSMLVELRSSDGSSGIQTAVPPSVHPSGEVIAWEKYGNPREIDGAELYELVRKVAVVSLLARHWPQVSGGRHDLALALAGYLLKNTELGEDVVAEVVELAAEIAGDDEVEDRRAVVATTARKLDAGDKVSGGGVLAGKLDKEVMDKLNEWLGIRNRRTTAGLGVPSGAPRTTGMLPSVAGEGLSPEMEFTDIGNAHRLAQMFGAKLRYVPQWGWVAYDGKCWQRGGDGQAMEYAKECVRSLIVEAAQTRIDRQRQDLLLVHAKRSGDAHRVKAMLELAQSEPGIAARVADFDKDQMLLNVENGTFDLHSGVLRPHDPADLITKIAHVTFDPAATAPIWERTVSEVFAGDEVLARYFQRAQGYSTTGITREQVFFMCYGAGCNGKSTLLGAVARVLGDYAKPLKADVLMANQQRNPTAPDNEVAALVGARFVTAQEPHGGELDEAKIKELTGGDPMQVRENHKAPFTLVPQFKLWLSTNSRPKVTETNNGIWRRIRLIPFTVDLTDRKDDPLPEKLAGEASGILNWLIEGCRAWQEERLEPADAVKNATDEYRAEEDPYNEFFTTVLKRAPGSSVLLKDAYEAYNTWQQEDPERPPLTVNRAFSKQAEAHGFQVKAGTGNKRYVLGCIFAAEGA